MAIPTGTTEVDNVRTVLGLDVLINLRLKAQTEAYCVMPSATPKLAIRANRREVKSVLVGGIAANSKSFAGQNQYFVFGSQFADPGCDGIIPPSSFRP